MYMQENKASVCTNVRWNRRKNNPKHTETQIRNMKWRKIIKLKKKMEKEKIKKLTSMQKEQCNKLKLSHKGELGFHQ